MVGEAGVGRGYWELMEGSYGSVSNHGSRF